MPKALVVGYSGFIGSELWRQLSRRGFDLVGISSATVALKSPLKSASVMPLVASELNDLLRGQRFDHIFLSANLFSRNPHPNSREMEEIVFVNSVLPMRIIELALAEQTFVTNLSSFWALPSHNMRALPYSQSKSRLVDELNECVPSSRLAHYFLTDTLGPGDRRGKIAQKVVEAKILRVPLQLNEPSAVISLSHVEDLVCGILDNADEPRAGRFLVIGTYTLTVGELLKAATSRDFKATTALEFLSDCNLTSANNLELMEVQSSRNLFTSLEEVEESLLAEQHNQLHSGENGSQVGG